MAVPPLGRPLGLGASAPGRETPEVGPSSPTPSFHWLGLPHPGPGKSLGQGEGAKRLQMSAISLRAEVPREGWSRSPERPLAE